jgi:MFS family permease
MLRLAGVASNDTRLLLQGIQNVIQLFGAVLGALLTDKWGRRPQLLVSTSLMVLIFVIVAVLNATNPDTSTAEDEFSLKSPAQSKAQIAMIFIFGFVYSCGWTPNQSMYPVEVLRYESRAKGMGMYNFFVNIALFYNTFVTEIAFTRVGWRYYLLFVFWDMFEIVIIYFFFVETKRRTLEEITEIFQSKKPVKTSLRVTEVMVRHGEITGVVENEIT